MGKTVQGEVAFWDASAVVPLCIHQTATVRAQQEFRKFAQVVWWSCSVEVLSAIARLHRENQVSDLDKNRAIAKLKLLSTAWREIIPGEEVRSLALDLLAKYPLKAADSLQLAAALVWCGGRPARRAFICADRRLAAAAKGAGFALLELG